MDPTLSEFVCLGQVYVMSVCGVAIVVSKWLVKSQQSVAVVIVVVVVVVVFVIVVVV